MQTKVYVNRDGSIVSADNVGLHGPGGSYAMYDKDTRELSPMPSQPAEYHMPFGGFEPESEVTKQIRALTEIMKGVVGRQQQASRPGFGLRGKLASVGRFMLRVGKPLPVLSLWALTLANVFRNEHQGLPEAPLPEFVSDHLPSWDWRMITAAAITGLVAWSYHRLYRGQQS